MIKRKNEKKSQDFSQEHIYMDMYMTIHGHGNMPCPGLQKPLTTCKSATYRDIPHKPIRFKSKTEESSPCGIDGSGTEALACGHRELKQPDLFSDLPHIQQNGIDGHVLLEHILRG
jgi:hypothetical protein